MKYLPIFIPAFLILLSCKKESEILSDSLNLVTLNQENFDENNAFKLINDHLDNYAIRSSTEDLDLFRNELPVYSIRHYKLEETNDKLTTKTINGQNFSLKSYTEYLKDGRKRYKKYDYDLSTYIENYHYDENLENLLILHTTESGKDYKRNYYKVLSYDSNQILKDEVDYRNYKGTDFDFQKYIEYNTTSVDNSIQIEINEIGYDSIPYPIQIFTFSGNELIKEKPMFQSKKQYFEWINGKYLVKKIEDYVIDDRISTFTYDEKGYPLTEIWTLKNELENKTEFQYNSDYTERIQQDYHQRGTEKSTRFVKKYNANADLIFEETIEYTGNVLSPDTYEYVYDKNGNWIERKKFSKLNESDSNPELVSHEVREITYYNENAKIREFPTLPLSPKLNDIKNSIVKIASEKQKEIEDFNEAVSSGDFETKINIKTSKNLQDFTPKHWKIKEIAKGNLDQTPDEEAAIVYQTPMENEYGFVQSLAIYKKRGNQWNLWNQTHSPIMDTGSGGMMGNPFSGIEITNKTIVIHHFGGSRQKWNFTHRYRFQKGDWYLIGASYSGGAPCDYFEGLDYNLSTGQVVADFSKENCDENTDEPEVTNWKESFIHKIPLPKMNEFSPGENEIKISNREDYRYF